MEPWRPSPQYFDDSDPLADDPLLDEPQRKRRRGKRWWAVRILSGLLLAFFLLIAWLAVTAPLSKSLQPLSPPQITLLASDGTPFARSGALVEAPVRAKALPPHVTQAFVAIEDRRFYTHWGIDPRGMARAAWTNFRTGSKEGGSTITQQLAKFTFLTPDQNLTRKAREIVIALWLEAWLTKDQILERYLSNAYFGDNAYGLRAASLHYFHREPEQLSVGQAAMLAGLVKAPSKLAPTHNYDLAEKRMRLVLRTMVEAKYLTPEQAQGVPDPELDVRNRGDLPTGTYFADWALPEARKIDPTSYTAQTYKTTLDARLQAAARAAIARAPLGKAQAALVAMRPNGEIVAMVGGKDYADSPFNRATQARRQPGSTFKLFVYLSALDKGWKPDDHIDNTPITTGVYKPQNAGGAYSKTITLEDAFARSSNVAAIRLFNDVGDKAVIGTARRFGITAPLPAGDPSVALGSASVTLLELTSAYAGVAANRFPVTPTAFPPPTQGWIDWLLDRRHSLSDDEHDEIQSMLREVVSHGTGRAANMQHMVYGKTGTSQDNRDALFVGYVDNLVVGVWVGNDDNTSLVGNHGGGLPARIWHDFVSRALGEHATPKPRPNPAGPIQPLDLPSSIPAIDNAHVRLENGGATIGTTIDGAPLDVHIDRQGLHIDSHADENAKDGEQR
jgi:penicillin-binding protein 1A